MSKPIIAAGIGIVGIVLIIVVAVVFVNKKDNTDTSNNESSSQTQSEVTIDDPEGTYDFFSDPSVTNYPETHAVFGNGQTLTFEYDGSKTNDDSDATLPYQLYYISENGDVQPMGGGNTQGEGGKGTFTVSDKVFNSLAKDRPGFFELQGTYDTGISESGAMTGTNVTLGVYPISFDVSD
jgi:hypothetical protein